MFKSKYRYEFSNILGKKIWFTGSIKNKKLFMRFYNYKNTHKNELYEKFIELIKFQTGDNFDKIWEIIEHGVKLRKSDKYIISKIYNEIEITKISPLNDIKKLDIEGDILLDIGCGNGELTLEMGKHFNSKKIYGTDIINLETDKFLFLKTNGKEIPIGDHSVDIVTMISTIHHIFDFDIILEIKRILKPSGMFLLYDVDAKDEIADLLKLNHMFIDNSDIQYRSIGEIDKIINMTSLHEMKFNTPLRTFLKVWKYRNVHFRLLTAKIPRLKYKRRAIDIKNVLHWGQRKLLMGEIEFLTRFYKLYKPTKKIYMIYAGAASGIHLIILHQLFPKVHFELYDSNPFNKKLYKLDRINIHERYFFDSDAKIWASYNHPNKHILLVSDIRTADTLNMSSEEVERCVKEDHKMQRNWYEIMQPDYTMLKFRLPWEDGQTEYMKGKIFIQCWAPVTSTETRLIVEKNAKYVYYDNRDYEERLFHFNIYEREREYRNVLEELSKEEKEGLDNRYDSVTEINILKAVVDDIILWSKKISKVLGKRTLMDDNPLKKGRFLVIKMKEMGLIPKNAPLTQKTYNKYVIPKWGILVQLGLTEYIAHEELFIR